MVPNARCAYSERASRRRFAVLHVLTVRAENFTALQRNTSKWPASDRILSKKQGFDIKMAANGERCSS